jgi:hypothetical protein
MNSDDLIKAVLALGTGLGALVYGYQKFSVTRKKDETTVAEAGANTANFKSLYEAINRLSAEVVELRVEHQQMDRKLHRQQRTITRMEMLLRQFSGLVSQHGIEVPAYMQAELEALIEADVDRTPGSDPKEF